MSDRYELKAGRKYTTRDGQEKTQWTRVGTMFRSKNGDSFGITLDVMPLPEKDTGTIRIMAFVPEERTEGGQGQRGGYGTQQRQAAPAQYDGFEQVGEDGIPF